MSERPPVLLVDGVSKSFRLPREQVHTLKEKALHPLRRAGHDTLLALRDVSFAVEPGEFFGVVGRNGSGKSTLLKCMAGIYATDSGRIFVNGRLSTFIELGVGFNPDLPARDNVMINATMLGLSPREARRRFDRIVDFAELHEFVDMKLKNYSSGMLVRLAFSVMIQVDAEILLIDEVLAVGDAAFQQKCFEEFVRIHKDGTAVVLVTHDMAAVLRFCDRAMLLEHGRLADLGEPELVGARYLELNFSEKARAQEEAAAGGPAAVSSPATQAPPPEDTAVSDDDEPVRFGDGRATILDTWFEDEDGGRAEVLPAGRSCAFALRVEFHADVHDPLFGVNIHNSQDVMVFAANNLYLDGSGTYHDGDKVTVRIHFDNLLAPDRYFASPAVAHEGGGVQWLDRRIRSTSVMVTGTRPVDGVVAVPFTFDLQRGVRAPAYP